MSNAIRNTMMTSGWAEIVAKANSRIKENGLAMMLTRDEAEALKAHRAYCGAQDALQEFLQELEDESKESE